MSIQFNQFNHVINKPCITIGTFSEDCMIYHLDPTFNLTISRRRPLSYRNQSIDLLRKSVDWFLYDNGLRLERVKKKIWKSCDYSNREAYNVGNICFVYLYISHTRSWDKTNTKPQQNKACHGNHTALKLI